MRILVWGLGTVGSVSAACLARLGHEVIGIERDAAKVEAIHAGVCALKEPGLGPLVRETVATGRLRAARDGRPLVSGADASLICVGTPSAADGRPVLEDLLAACGDIGRGLRRSERYHAIVVRSTLLPGSVRARLLPVLQQASSRRAGADFGLAVNPEFLRETTAVSDFLEPPYVIVGGLDRRSIDAALALYDGIAAPVYRVSLEEAELLKLVNNVFHSLKIGFANEVGRLCDALGIDSLATMGMLCADTRLNISPAYLRPGFAFGGSCLPKDLRSLLFSARGLGVPLPIMEAILPSNEIQLEEAHGKVRELSVRSVGVLGLGFKPGTDDVRESPAIGLIRRLLEDGLDVRVYDPDVRFDTMLQCHRDHLQGVLPRIEAMFCSSLAELIGGPGAPPCVEAIVVTQRRPEFADALRARGRNLAVLDLARTEDRSWRLAGVFDPWDRSR
jgi:GDP-mannose 6-dehydrogenase